ncbi:ABC transporter permease [Cellulosimicrobium cellulans]|uniref:ABC transporter permease n=1 Tax=Cellulosimicrobium cellulans TaxID=1710 RepID=UPI001EDC4819|nr:ABC transporter permease [Cellulosimicrobium cellulans]MDF9877530.1 lipopolysaccharide transport system permease protein [Cellulosimicrobium cellulans]UKJ62235.1 ABC transporter permease [Cellulosimicrobium cellulans]
MEQTVQRTVITPPGRLNLPAWRELWNAREVAVRLALRDVIVRYRQTIFGITWVIAQPLVSAGIFTVVFGEIAGLSTGNVPTFLFTLAGMLAWNLFNGSLGRASSSMVGNQSLVQKVFFPRLLVPISSLASVVLDFLVALVLAVVLLFVFGINPGWAVLLLPVWVLLILMIGTGIGLAAAAYMVKYRDVGYVLPWLVQILLYASPVAYALSSVPENLRWLFDINPVTWFLETFRWSLVGTDFPPTWQVVALVVAAPLIFLAGTLVFQKNEREFADFI